MKRLQMNLICIVVLAVIGSGMNLQAQSRMNQYAVKKAVITYKYTGMSEGTETLYFTDYGQKEARYSEMTTSAFGFTTTTKELSLILGAVHYTIDLVNKTGVKQTIMADFMEMDEKEVKEMEELGKEMMEGMGFEKTGTEVFLGKKCDIWEGMGTKSWVWKNLTLKSEVNMMGKMTIEATKIDLNPNIPASKFKVPDGISFDESDIDDEENMSSEELQEGLNQLKGILGTKKKK